MRNFTILSDGSCDLTAEEAKKLNVEIIPFYVAFEEGAYFSQNEMDVQNFYQKLVDEPTVFPKTSMPTQETYYNAFEKAFQSQKDILCITITKKFSGSYNSASTAKDMFLENYPTAKVEVIDSTVNTVLQGLLVKEIVRMKEAGLTIDQIVAKVEEIKSTGRIYFTVNGLSYLEHGGRIGKLSAIIGNMLKLNPLIVLKNGEIQSGGIALSRKRAILKIMDKLKDSITKYNMDLKDYVLSVGYGHSKEEAQLFVAKIEEVFQKKVEHLSQIGVTIAVHTGPHPLGLAFLKKYDA